MLSSVGDSIVLTASTVVTPDDLAVVRAVLDGDREAFRILVDRESSSVVRACYRVLGDVHEAEDVAQEAFVTAFRSLSTWRGEGPFGAWLSRIAVRLAVRQLSRRRRITWLRPADGAGVDAEMVAALPADRAVEPEHVAVAAERAEAARRAVADLEEPYREVVALRFFGERSLEEIATLTGRPLGTVEDAPAAGPHPVARPGRARGGDVTGPRSFRADELGAGDARELQRAFEAGRWLEAGTAQAAPELAFDPNGFRTMATPSAGFEDRVMAALADEPIPGAVGFLTPLRRDGAVAGFAASVRQAWRAALGSGRPLAGRASALAYVLAIVIAGTSLAGVATVGAAGALGLLGPNQTTRPNPTAPLPSQPALIIPLPTMAPPSSDPIESPSEPADGSGDPGATFDDHGGGPEPSDDHGGNSGPGSSDDSSPGSSSSNSGQGSGSETPQPSRTPRPSQTPKPSETPHP